MYSTYFMEALARQRINDLQETPIREQLAHPARVRRLIGRRRRRWAPLASQSAKRPVTRSE